MIFLKAMLAIILGALGRRIAGGVFSQWLNYNVGTQLQRGLWGGLSACIAAWYGMQPWWHPVGIGAGIALGSAIVGFHGSMTMGHKPGCNFWTDAFWMTVHGVGGMLIPAAFVWKVGYNPLWLLIAGLLCAPCYAVAWWWPWNIPWLGCYKTDPPPTAELIWGAFVGLAVGLTAVVT